MEGVRVDGVRVDGARMDGAGVEGVEVDGVMVERLVWRELRWMFSSIPDWSLSRGSASMLGARLWRVRLAVCFCPS